MKRSDVAVGWGHGQQWPVQFDDRPARADRHLKQAGERDIRRFDDDGISRGVTGSGLASGSMSSLNRVMPRQYWANDSVEEISDTGDHLRLCFFEQQIPAEIGVAAGDLYGSLYSSIALLESNASLTPDTSTFVMYRNGVPDAIFLLRISAGQINVINEGMTLQEEQVRRFCRYVFQRFPRVSMIRFSQICWKGGSALPYPHQHFNTLENIVLTLPATAQQYHASLGKNTRRNLKRYSERLLRDFPNYQYSVCDGSAAREDDVRAIIGLNVARMRSKNKSSAYDLAETERLVGLVKRCGLVGVARIDGRVCAGAISFRTGANYALSVLAHDPIYNEYSLGMLCAYHIICDCIARGGHEFHFLWGRYEYKYLLMAVQRDLDRLVVFRSLLQAVLHPEVVFGNWLDDARRRMHIWLQDAATSDKLAARGAMQLLHLKRRLMATLANAKNFR